MREKLPKSESRQEKELKSIERKKRRVEVEKMILHGISDPTSIANRFGITKAKAGEDIRWCYKRLALRDNDLRYHRKAVRVAELFGIINKALVAFERSQESEETVTVKVEKGEEIETRTVKGQAGDPAFLRVAKDAYVEIAKLDGLYVTKHEVASAANSPIPQEKVKELDERLMAITERLRARGNSVPSNN